jgi:hypothetical protein
VANVQLPTVNPDQDMEKLVKQLLNVYIMLTEELTYLLNNLDTRNVNELNAEVITAGSITADKIQAGSITADKMDVNELSAISANLGHIIAGLIESVEIYGSYIATRRTGYPRAEMSNIDNMFSASQSSTSNIKIEAAGRQASSPEISVNSGSGSMTLFQQGGQSAILASGSAGLTLFGIDINLSPLSSGRVNVPFSKLIDTETNLSLRQQLDR